MKKKLQRVTFFTLLSFLCLNTQAQNTITNDDILYLISESGSGELTLVKGKNVEEITIPSTVTYNGMEYPVTAIEGGAFSNMTSIKSVVIPSGVKSIGTSAFINCRSLVNVKIPATVKKIGAFAFSDCIKLTSVNIPGGVKIIEKSSFANCRALASVEMPQTVTVIRDEAFNFCRSLSKLSLPVSLTTLGNAVFSNCATLSTINIPENLKVIGDNIFINCPSLKTPLFTDKVFLFLPTNYNDYTVPEGIEVINGGAFTKNPVKAVILPSTLKVIGNSAFSHSSIREINIPFGVTDIMDNAFYSCPYLAKVTLPNSLENIGSSVFSDSKLLVKPIYTKKIFAYLPITYQKYVVPKGIEKISSGAFSECKYLEVLSLPPSVNYIGDYAFFNCNALKEPIYTEKIFAYLPATFAEFNIPQGITEICGGAFYGCNLLESVVLPNSIEIIREDAFYMCSSLSSLTIPENVKKIGAYAFNNCSNLKEIYINRAKPLSLNYDLMFDSSNTKLFVPEGCKTEYQNASTWKGFSEIVEYKFKSVEPLIINAGSKTENKQDSVKSVIPEI